MTRMSVSSLALVGCLVLAAAWPVASAQAGLVIDSAVPGYVQAAAGTVGTVTNDEDNQNVSVTTSVPQYVATSATRTGNTAQAGADIQMTDVVFSATLHHGSDQAYANGVTQIQFQVDAPMHFVLSGNLSSTNVAGARTTYDVNLYRVDTNASLANDSLFTYAANASYVMPSTLSGELVPNVTYAIAFSAGTFASGSTGDADATVGGRMALTPAPEPASLGLLSLGGLALLRRRG